MRYWQIAAGSDSRDYSEDFLRYGLAFVGGKDHIPTMGQVAAGDRILLKRGLGEILAAGVVVERDGRCSGDARQDGGQKEWLRDYDGWELPAYCYVEWHREPAPRAAAGMGLVRGTIKKVHQAALKSVAEEILKTAPCCSRQPEPETTAKLDDDAMLEFLIRAGLRPSAAEDLTNTLRRIRLLAHYYYEHCEWDDVREHEARTFLIIPFLLALGWSEQQVKIELGVPGGRIDVACFTRPYRRDEATKRPNNADCVLILESKGFSQGLDYAHGQGKAYAAAFPSCHVVVTSNGYCYKAYRRQASGVDFEEAPAAYLNLLRPRVEYPLAPKTVGGGLELLSYLLAQNQAIALTDHETRHAEERLEQIAPVE